jgi:hypothetical protein
MFFTTLIGWATIAPVFLPIGGNWTAGRRIKYAVSLLALMFVVAYVVNRPHGFYRVLFGTFVIAAGWLVRRIYKEQSLS